MGAKQIKRLVFVDVETTAKLGPESRADAIIEIAASVVDLGTRQILDSFEALIKPSGPQALPHFGWDEGGKSLGLTWDLGEYHVKAGHFAGVDWSTAIDLSLALDILAGRFFTEGATIAGQNPRFDLDHLRRDFDAIKMPWPALDYHVPDLCSSALFLVMAGKVDGVSLRNVIPWAYADPNRKQAHRARGDVNDAIRVFFAMFDYFTKGFNPAPGEGPWS